jgi:hypothetical protein
LGQIGAKFAAASENEKKQMLAEKIASFAHYKDIFIRLKNDPEKSIKKEEITDMWLTITGGGKAIRYGYTASFSSLASWSGIVSDSGRTLKLTEFGTALLEGKPSAPTAGPEKPSQPPSQIETGALSLSCPMCKGTDIGLKSEEIAQTIPTKTGHLVYVKNTNFCRNCARDFTRLVQQSFEGAAS